MGNRFYILLMRLRSPFEPTIKYFQDVKLFLCLEEFKVQSDVVSLFHINEPGAHLQVGVAVRIAWTQDHPRGVKAHLMGWALD